MDIQRIVLFAGLAIVSYLMVLAWNEDYHQPPETAQVAESQPSQTAGNMGNSDNMVLPEDSSAQVDGDGEFTTPETGQAVISSTETTTAVSDQFITVRTDVYDLQIDRVSGNLVKARLLDYDDTLNSEKPLTLLNNTQNRLYVLESGLIGRDGPDSRKNGSAPVYSADAASYELAEGDNQLQVDLTYTSDNGVQITKRYEFERNSYEIGVKYLVENQSSEEWQANFTGKIVRDQSPDPTSQTSMGIQAFLGLVISSRKIPTRSLISEISRKTRSISLLLTAGWPSCSTTSCRHGYRSAIFPPSTRPRAVARTM